MRAKITLPDIQFIVSHLNASEQKIFWGMGLPDQYHCLRVAQDALRLSEGVKEADRQLLARCALLHDVGRRKDDVSTWDKIFTVLLHQIASKKARDWGREGRGSRTDNLRHAVYVYFNHPQISAKILQEIGLEEKIIDIVAAHHRPAAIDDPPELKLLKAADEMN
jgi:putative nucleotidyltransferase with HDIG domain